MATSARAALTVGAEAGKKKRKAEVVTVNMVGEEYPARVPKTATALRFARLAKKASESKEEAGFALMDAIDQYIVDVFGEENAERIRERLEDDEDSLDFTHITELMNALMERAAAQDPTT